MKKGYAMFLLGICLLATACTEPVESAAASRDTTPQVASEGPVPGMESAPEREEKDEAYEALGDFLAEELVALYETAKQAMYGFQMSAGHFGTLYQWDEGEQSDQHTTEVDGVRRYRMTGRWLYWDDFYSGMTEIFTPEFFQKLNEPEGTRVTYVEIDGYTYYTDGDRGSNIAWLYDRYQPVRLEEERVEFNVIGTYIDWEANDEETLDWVYHPRPDFEGITYDRAYPCVMVRVDGKWLVEEMYLTL